MPQEFFAGKEGEAIEFDYKFTLKLLKIIFINKP